MLGLILAEAQINPTVIVGSLVPQFKGNARIGTSPYMVVEADEYQNKLRYYDPYGVVLTNIDFDHPDFFKTRRSYQAAFRAFIKKIPQNGFLVGNADDVVSRDVMRSCKGVVVTFGLSNRAMYYAKNIRVTSRGMRCVVWREKKQLGTLYVSLYGEHNIANALAAIAAAMQLGISFADCVKALRKFQGTERRFQKKGTYRGTLIYDDYAHHPTEIAATLLAAKKRFPRKHIVCLFHPHTFSRTQMFFKEFSTSLSLADAVWVMDIYGSAREECVTVHARDITERLLKKGCDAVYVGGIKSATVYAKTHLQKNDILITMGAGDVWKVGQQLYGRKK